MATRTSYTASQPGFVVDHASMDRIDGRQIDWSAVNASYIDAATGKKRLPAGTAIGEVTAGGKIAERVVTTRPAVGLLATDAVEGDKSAALSGYGVFVGGVVYENLLPGGAPAAAVKTELQTAGVTTGWRWVTYGDTRNA